MNHSSILFMEKYEDDIKEIIMHYHQKRKRIFFGVQEI